MGFQYQPLEPNEFRLLDPVSGPSSTLSFELIHRPLPSKPRYVALSYAWGPEPDPHVILPTIQLNKQQFAVRENLHNALQQIKASKLVNIYLWVDAICINQDKHDKFAQNERSLQITLMKQIYVQAAKVIVWLGTPENVKENRLAFSMMKRFEKRFSKFQQKRQPYRPWWWKRKDNPLFTPSQDVAAFLLTISPAKDKTILDVPESLTYAAWLGMISLWEKPWWTRTWVYQESTIPEPFLAHVVLRIRFPPARKVKFICGDQETNWEQLSITRLIASNILERKPPGIDSRLTLGVYKSALKLELFRSNRWDHHPSFLDSLQIFRHTICSDLRDKVYAPLCLAPDDVRPFIQPDYAGKTVSDVYVDVARYCLEQPGHELDFLGYTLYQDETQEVETPKNLKWPDGFKSALPSWIPNFSANINIVPIPKTLHVPNDPQRHFMWNDKRDFYGGNETLVAAYRPLGDTPSRSFIDRTTLYVNGVYVDSVKDISRNTGPNVEAILATAREKGREWTIDAKNKYFTGESFGDAALHTCVLDLVYNVRGKPLQRGGKRDAALMKRPRVELNTAEFSLQRSMKTAETAAANSRNMALSQKRYLLMVPITALVGDLIWAMAGGQALYILRPVSQEQKQYRFIGECYAHGLMDGEILRRLQLGEATMDDISLV